MTPEQFMEKIRHAMPAGLRAVILYGSAAAGDYVAKRSDYNILVVADTLGTTELNALGRACQGWLKAGNPPPALFTPDRLRGSADTFPLELLDIQHTRRVLFGDDVVADITVPRDALRLQLERELKEKLLRLRTRYLVTGGRPREIVALMTDSVAAFLVLCRGALRLCQAAVPERKLEALDALAGYLPVDVAVLRTVDGLRRGELRAQDIDERELFGRYLATVEALVDAIDNDILHPGAERSTTDE